MGMIDEELEELELAAGQPHLLASVPDHRSLTIEVQALERPEALVPQIEANLVALHLALDDCEIGRSRLLSNRSELGQLALYAAQKPDLEPEQVGVHPEPMPRILPMLRFEIFPLESARTLGHVD